MALSSSVQVLIMKKNKILKKLAFLNCICALIFALCSCSAPDERENSAVYETATKRETVTTPETAATPAETTPSDEEAAQILDRKTEELRRTLENDTTDPDKIKQVNGAELKNVDFTDCKIAALDSWAEKIYEYLSEEKTKEFIDRITEADISSEVYDDISDYSGGAFSHRFRITLNTGEVIYIGALSPDNIDMILINGYNGYPCGEKLCGYICDCYREFERRFYEKVKNAEKPSEVTTAQPPKAAVSDTVLSQEDEYFRSLKDEYFRSLEDSEIDKEKIKQLNSEELKNVDFTDCSIGVFSPYGEKILEYLSAEDVKSFIDCIAKAEIGTEEFEPKKSVGGGGSLMYQITLKTGEQIYIGAQYYGKSHDPMLIINREHGYWCDKASVDKITQYQSIAYNNFDKAAAEYAESVTANVVS